MTSKLSDWMQDSDGRCVVASFTMKCFKDSVSEQSKGFGYNFKKVRSSYKMWLLLIIIIKTPSFVQSSGHHFWPTPPTPPPSTVKNHSVHSLASAKTRGPKAASALEITQGTCDSCSVLCLLFELSCLRNVRSILLIGFNYHLHPLMNTMSLCSPWHFFVALILRYC